MENLTYLLFEFGLFINAVVTLGVIVVVGEMPTRPPDYYFYAIWLSSVACAAGFGYYIMHPFHPSWMGVVIVNVWGVEHSGVLYYYKTGLGQQLTILQIRRANRLVSFVSLGLMLASGGYALFFMIKDLKKDTTAQVEKALKIRNVVADSTLVRQLRAENAEQLLKISANLRRINVLNLLIESQTRQIGNLTATLATMNATLNSVQKSVKQVGVNVERTRRQTVTPQRIAPQKVPNVQIDRNKVKTSSKYGPDQTTKVADAAPALFGPRRAGAAHLAHRGYVEAQASTNASPAPASY